MTATPAPTTSSARPTVALVLPAYNEAALVQQSLRILCDYMAARDAEYDWDIVLVNDGSADDTAALADEFARTNPHVTVLHHPVNFGMGQALITAFRHTHADYLVTLDLDLSFAPDHIGALLTAIRKTGAKVVVASPFAKGGRMSNVPWLREAASRWANRFLARVANVRLTSITGVGRAYDGPFVRSLNLKATGMDINPEVIFKAMMLQARVVEIPAHLDWGFQLASGPARRSKMRIGRHVVSTLVSGFVLRPTHFFLIPGLVLLAFSLYTNVWMFIHWWTEFSALGHHTWFLDRASEATRESFRLNPHTFVIGGLSMVAAFQILGLAFLSLQQKKYFEELFHLGIGLNARLRREDETPKS